MRDLNLEFDFSEDRERFPELKHLRKGDTVRLEQLLLWFGDRPEEEAEAAALELERRGVDLDVSAYRRAGASGAAAQRLDREAALAAEGRLEELGPEDPLTMTLAEYGELPRLTESRAEELWDRLRNGEDQWAETLTTGCLALVGELAKAMTGKGVLLLDLMQEGSLSLWQTVTEARAERFLPVARRRVTQAMARQILRQALADHAGEDLARQMEAYRKAAVSLMKKLGRTPSNEEIAAELNLPIEKIIEANRTAADTLSLDMPVGDEEDTTIGSFVEDDNTPSPADATSNTLLAEALTEILGTLTDREADVLRMRFGMFDGRTHTLEEVGQIFGVTRERIRQIENKAIRKLRHPSRARKIRDFYA